MRFTALALCLCAALVGSAMARPGSFGAGHAKPSNITTHRKPFPTGSPSKDFCSEVSQAGGWSAIPAETNIFALQMADEEVRNVTLARMEKLVPYRARHCHSKNRTESIEGCSRSANGTEYQLRLTVTCVHRNHTNGTAVEIIGVVDALVTIPTSGKPSIDLMGPALSVGGKWVKAAHGNHTTTHTKGMHKGRTPVHKMTHKTNGTHPASTMPAGQPASPKPSGR